ncbi:ABC transporter permease [Prolixibacter denitrificans]|uniref:ABC-2 type transport system permease protein n=1 Tax=Prolixibacter denitrificans TaxID=1541063 RepID=A0A2P8CCR4_9BACT|nr:ABC transporter permease [Prolixibacter denitrificans]PSK82766.1 ABC-2 type transport system permease protein [Prolixibacter denitrificans]GET21416.1 transport permease protein [Prolixibacter denitrificans]
MKQLRGFIRKEFHHIFRDSRTMLILFGIPIIQLLLFGYVITTEIKDARIAILDKSHDEVTREITHKLLSSGYFRLDAMLDNEGQIDNIFRQGNIKEVVVFEQNFGKKLERDGKADVQVITDASDPNTAQLLSNYTNAIVQDYLQKKFVNYKIPLEIKPQVRMLFNESLMGAFTYVPGTMALILILISAMMTSITIVREKEMGTMEILLVSPLKSHHIIIGKVAPYLILSILNALIIIGMGYLIFGVPVRGSFILLMFVVIVYILLALSLGILISTISDSQVKAMFVSVMILMLPTILLSGFIYPIDNMPVALQVFSNIMPARWFIEAVKAVMLKGVGTGYIWKQILIMTGMTILFLGISVKKFKLRLE